VPISAPQARIGLVITGFTKVDLLLVGSFQQTVRAWTARPPSPFSLVQRNAYLNRAGFVGGSIS
jgi:hypothetical protein